LNSVERIAESGPEKPVEKDTSTDEEIGEPECISTIFKTFGVD
jgi:hypothetical protein